MPDDGSTATGWLTEAGVGSGDLVALALHPDRIAYATTGASAAFDTADPAAAKTKPKRRSASTSKNLRPNLPIASHWRERLEARSESLEIQLRVSASVSSSSL